MELNLSNPRHVAALCFVVLGIGLLLYSIVRHKRAKKEANKLLIHLSILVLSFGPYFMKEEIYNLLGVGERDFVARHIIEGIVWIWFTYLIIRTIYVFLWRGILTVDNELLVPQFLVHITNVLVILVVSILFLYFVVGKDVTALAAGAGALLLGIGYLAHTPLQCVFAGLSFALSPMFRKGDWVSFSGEKVGQISGVVTDMGWLHVTIRAKEGHLIYVLNILVEDSLVQNFTRPTPHPALETEVTLEYEFPLSRARELIQAALRDVGAALQTFTVNTERYGRFGITYLIRFVMNPGHHHYHDIVHNIHSAVYYRIQQERSLDYGYDKFNSVQSTSVAEKLTTMHQLFSASRTVSLKERQTSIRGMEIFAALGDADITSLAETCGVLAFGPPEHIVKQGDLGDSMFVVFSGQVRVYLTLGKKEVELVTRGPGGHFGEMALLTGEPRGANVAALSEVVVLEIKKENLKPILQKEPELVSSIAMAVTRMQEEDKALISAHEHSQEELAKINARSNAIRKSLLHFFGLDADA